LKRKTPEDSPPADLQLSVRRKAGGEAAPAKAKFADFDGVASALHEDEIPPGAKCYFCKKGIAFTDRKPTFLFAFSSTTKGA
jgi:hypothetical protein